jgi:RNA polymerase sigma-70 factor (ECF subfamily)
MTDNELAAKYRKGDAEAFTTLYHRHKDVFYTYLRNRAPAEADDIFQEAYMKFAEAISKRDIAYPRAYLYTIGLNLVRNLGRRKPTVALEESEELPDENAANPDLDFELEQEELREAMALLAVNRPAFYDVLHLRVFEELSFDAVAATLERNRNTVTAQYRYALRHLRRYIEEIHDRA